MSGSSSTSGWVGGGRAVSYRGASSRFDEDTAASPGEEQPAPIVVHQDAGPVAEELPPVYANR